MDIELSYQLIKLADIMMNLQTTLHQIEFFWKDVHYQITMIDRMRIDINEQPQFPSLT